MGNMATLNQRNIIESDTIFQIILFMECTKYTEKRFS